MAIKLQAKGENRGQIFGGFCKKLRQDLKTLFKASVSVKPSYLFLNSCVILAGFEYIYLK